MTWSWSNPHLHSYLFNPLTLLSGLAKSSVVLSHLTIVAALYHAIEGETTLAALLLAAGTYIALHPLMMLAPVMAFTPSGQKRRLLIIFAISVVLLLGISWKTTNTWRFLLTSVLSRLSYESLKPNIGLYWYLFMEMFDFFRPLFVTFLQLHSFFYPFPLYVRFKHDPFFLSFATVAIMALIQPYPTAADAGLFLSMIAMFPELQSQWILLPWALLFLPVSIVLAPVMWQLWIVQGSGNANFYYAATLLYNAPLFLVLIDMLRSRIMESILRLNPAVNPEHIWQK